MNWWRKFYDTPVKNKAETYEKDTEMGRNNDYTIIIQNILFKTLQTNSNRFKQANWIIKCWFKTTNNVIGRHNKDNVAMFFNQWKIRINNF